VTALLLNILRLLFGRPVRIQNRPCPPPLRVVPPKDPDCDCELCPCRRAAR
jgi:hypothetical protein